MTKMSKEFYLKPRSRNDEDDRKGNQHTRMHIMQVPRFESGTSCISSASSFAELFTTLLIIRRKHKKIQQLICCVLIRCIVVALKTSKQNSTCSNFLILLKILVGATKKSIFKFNNCHLLKIFSIYVWENKL